MTIVKGCYDDIHWTECNIESYTLDKKTRVIEVYIKDSLEVYPPHPLSGILTSEDKCKVIIKDVVESHQKFSPYKGKPTKGVFGPREYIKDDFAPDRQAEKKYQDFSVEGVVVNANGKGKGWLSWDIIAGEFHLDDLK